MTITPHRWSHRAARRLGIVRLTVPSDGRGDSQTLLRGHFRRPLPFAGDRRPLPGVNDSIPPCAVTINARPARVRPSTSSDTVADLARALDADPTAGLWFDGVPAGPDETLAASGLRAGSSVGTEAPPPSGGDPGGDVDRDVPVGVAVVAGPACLVQRPLRPGRHRVGRAPGNDVHIEDPAVELHHGLIDVTVDGSVRFTQLTGRVPVRVHDPADIRIGASRVAVTPPTPGPERVGGGSVTSADRDPWHRVVHRSPTAAPVPNSAAIVPPEQVRELHGPPLIGLVGAGVAAGGAGLMAALLGQPLFALFGAVGALASVASWAVGAIGVRHRRRRALDERNRQVERFVTELAVAHAAAESAHRREHRPVGDALAAAHDVADAPCRIWMRRTGPERSLRVTLGRGAVRWIAPIERRDDLDADLLVVVERAERLVDVAVPCSLPAGRIVAFHGDLDPVTALGRSTIVQLATWYGPADWRLVVVTDRPDEWSWANWLPHAVDGAPVVCALDEHAADRLGDVAVTGGQQLVVVTDAPHALSSRTGPLRRLLEATDAVGIVVTPATDAVPAVCAGVLELGVAGRARWHHDIDGPCIHVAGLSRRTAENVARRLAPLLDPEDPDGGAAGVPSALRLDELLGHLDAATIADGWTRAGPDPAPVATIGRSGDGTVAIDLVRDGPHALIAGTTGAGKSELLRTFVVALAAAVGPDHLNVVLVDFKGGATFDACARLPHCVGVVTDLDEGIAERAIVSLDAEIRRRERLLRDVRAEDLTGYRRNATEPLPRLVVVVDEFATVAKELPEVLTALVGIAQRGRSLGVHLVLATQRPAGVVTDDIRANTNLRLALRVHDRSDATDVVGDELPATIPRSLPGRAVLRLGPDELVVFQTASCTGPLGTPGTGLVVEWPDATTVTGHASPTELELLVDAIGRAAERAGIAAPRRPWLDPLPDRLERPDLEADVGRCAATVGLVDDPAAQTRRALQWRRESGNLLVVGALGAGTTTTAMAVAASRLRTRTPDQMHLYVLDGRGDAGLDAFADVAHCGGVVRATEAERLDRLLRRLVDDLDRRSLGGGPHPEVLLLVDGIESVRAALSSVERTESAVMLDRILQDGPAVGVVTCATTDGSAAAVLATVTGERWVHHVDDPSIARAVGLASPPPRVPGRLCVAATGLTAQVVLEPDGFAGLPGRTPGVGPREVGILPAVLDPEELPSASSGNDLVVGLAADDLEPAVLRVPVGDHVFVGGATATGKTTALRRLAAAWAATHPDGAVVWVDRRRPPAEPPDGPALVVVDDADRVDDPHGVLAATIAGRHPGVTIVAAARLEVTRAAYGHWVRDVTRSRCGLVLTAPGDVDGELLGATLPRRTVIAPRPGLAWLVDARGHRLVQVAARMPT